MFKNKKMYSVFKKASTSSSTKVVKKVCLATIGLYIIYLFFLGVFYSDKKYAQATDFLSYYTAASLIKDGRGGRLYSPSMQARFQHKLLGLENIKLSLPFKSIPPAALFYLPFSDLTYLTAYRSFIILSFTGLLIFVYFLSKALNVVYQRFFFILSFLYLPSVYAVRSGQLSVLAALIFSGIFYFLKKRPLAAGLFTSLLLIKPQLILIFPFVFFLTNKKKSYLKGLAAGGLIFVLLSILISGWNVFIDYPKFLFTTETVKHGSDPLRMYTFNSFLVNNGLGFGWSLILNFLVYLFSLFLFIKNHKKLDFEIKFSAALLLTMAFSVHLQPHDLLALLIPIFISLNVFVKDKSRFGALYLISAGLLFFAFDIARLTEPFVASFVFVAVSLVFLKIRPKSLST